MVEIGGFMKAGNWAGLGVLFLLLTCLFPPALLASLVCFIGMVVAMQQAHGVALANAAATPKPMMPKMTAKDRRREFKFASIVILSLLTLAVLMLWLSGEYDHLFW
jgi:hypothetical protein